VLGDGVEWPSDGTGDEVVEILEKSTEDRCRAGQRICDYRLRVGRETTRRISQAQKGETTMSQAKFPSGWDEEKVRAVLAHYEEQTGQNALLEDEAGYGAAGNSDERPPRSRA
jgi:hypothetical protein